MSALSPGRRLLTCRRVVVEWMSAMGDDSSCLEIRVVGSDPGSVTVQLDGEVDVTNAPVLREAISAQAGRGHRFVRLDVSGLTFCDAAGLGVIVGAHNLLLASRGTLVLVGVGGVVARLLQITSLDQVLFVATVGDAPSTRRGGLRSTCVAHGYR